MSNESVSGCGSTGTGISRDVSIGNVDLCMW